LAFAQDLLIAIVQHKPARDAIKKSGLVEFILGKALYACQPGAHSDLRQTSLLCLTELWCAFPQVIMTGRQGQADQIVDALKRGARDTSISLQIACIANLFHLLEITVNDSLNPRNPYAPKVYKILIFLIIENHSNEIVREFLVTNLSTSLEPAKEFQFNEDGSLNKMVQIPVGVLIDPLVKQASTHGYNNFDFELFSVLSRHERLTVDQCMPLADLLGKIALNDPLFGRSASKPLDILLRRFGDQTRMHEYVERFAKVSLATFMHVETKYGGQMRNQRDKNKAGASKDNRGGEEIDYNVLVIRHALIIFMLEIVAKIDNPIYNYRMLPLMERVNENYAKLNNGEKAKGISALIKLIRVDGDNEDDGVEEQGDFEYASDDDYNDGSGYTRGKRSNNSGNNRDLMDAARRGQILVFSDEEDDREEGGRDGTNNNEEDDETYDSRFERRDGSDTGSETDEFVSTGKGGKRVFKRGAEFPSVNTDDLLNNNVNSPQRRKPTQPKGSKNRAAPSPRQSRVKNKSGQQNEKVLGARSSKDKKIHEYKRGRSEAAKLRLKKQQESWMVGKRKIKMKIKKAPKTVQGDIDAHKSKHEQRLRNRERIAREKEYREQQVRKRMRIQFERKLAFKQMYRRRAIEDRKRGVKSIALFGRVDRGDRHAGNFYERQDAMLKMQLDAAGESDKKIEEAQAWIDLSMKLFKKWLRPLQHIFTIYTSEFVNAFSPAFDFQALMERSGGLAIGEYMKLSRDFRLVPKIMNKTESLSLYHYANAEDGNRTARHNEPLLGFEELISCLHGVAMGPTFNSLPHVKDKIDALCAFMRREAITQGKGNKILHRRLGNKTHWEDGRCPMYEYLWIIPPSLPMKDSLRHSLEILDEMVAAAANVHILDLVKVDWEPTEEEEEEEWEPPNTTPLQNDSLYPTEIIEKNKAQIHPAAASHVYGFGCGFVPPPKPARIKISRERRFGEKVIGKLPLRFVPAAKYMISLLAELADDCAAGKARKRLLMKYDIQGIGWNAVTTATIRPGKSNYMTPMGHRALVVPPEPVFTSPRQKEKIDIKRLREQHEWEEKEIEREEKRRQRVAELEELVIVQRDAREKLLQKKKDEDEKLRKRNHEKEMKRRKEIERQTLQQKREVEQWKANGGSYGGGNRVTKMGDYTNYMNTSSRDPKAYAEEKRKKMADMAKRKEERKKEEERAIQLRQKKIDMAEESRRKAVEKQKKKQEEARRKKKEDEKLALEVAEEGMVGTDDLYGAKEESAALKIENKFRQQKAKKRVAEMRQERKKEDAAAVKLEAVARG
jgi:hypothetical protein